MQSLLLVKDLFIILVVLSFTACGGGGSPAPSADCLKLPGEYTTLCVDKSVRNESLTAKYSHLFQFEAVKGETYSIVITPESGNPDIGLFSTESFDLDGLIGESINKSTNQEIISFVADKTGVYYVQVYAQSETKYEIKLVTGIENLAPVAYAGYAREVQKNQLVSLSGKSSFDPNKDGLSFSWIQKSGPEISIINSNTDSPHFKAPATECVVVIELVVSDGKLKSKPEEIVIRIKNSAPVIQALVLSPDPVYTNDELTVEFRIYDHDGDKPVVYIVWEKNGVVIPGETGSVIASTNFVKDDQVTVTVTAFDGSHSTASSRSIIIKDSPVELNIISDLTKADYGVLSNFTVAANDPDGDPVALELLYGPAGMSIDSGTGEVSWIPNGPMFDNKIEVTWAVRATSSGVSSDATGKILSMTQPENNRLSGVELLSLICKMEWPFLILIVMV